MKGRLVVVTALFVLAAAACGGGGHEDHGSAGGTAAEADRTIEVTASDSLEFDPSSIDVSAGETVTFVVTNDGEIDHEFVLGDRTAQAEHEEMMADGHEMDDSGDAISLAPGETKELTYEFSDAGELQYGCHEPGHYDGGMFGTITVE